VTPESMVQAMAACEHAYARSDLVAEYRKPKE